jgi:dephospho-CoA kinase
MTDLKLKSTYITQTSSARLYGLSLPIIGLTGGIATGKTTVSKLLKQKGFPLIDADKLVHKIYADSKTIHFIKDLAPKCVLNEKIDFKALRSLFFSDLIIQKKVEEYIYKELPHVFQQSLESLKSPQFVIYDVPLLFEKKLETLLDYTITVYCDEETQIKRLIKRDSIDLYLAKSILAKQLPINIKKDKAHYVIDNSGSIDDLTKKVDELIARLLA